MKPKRNFLLFFEHYERVLADQRYPQLFVDFKMMETILILANVRMM